MIDHGIELSSVQLQCGLYRLKVRSLSQLDQVFTERTIVYQTPTRSSFGMILPIASLLPDR